MVRQEVSDCRGHGRNRAAGERSRDATRGLILPVLKNVYLPSVLDMWVKKAVRTKLKGERYYVRYVDGYVLLFQYENEARLAVDRLRAQHNWRSSRSPCS